MANFRTALSFDDVLLVPKHSSVLSRKYIDISSSLGKNKYELPILSSPMDTVTESEMVACMSKLGGLGVIHRYNSIEDQVKLAIEASGKGAIQIAAAIGVSGDYEERSQELYCSGVRTLCIDIAHGHHKMMRDSIGKLRKMFGDTISIIAGNVATLEGFEFLADSGADAIRVGVGGGSICSTRIQTGHGIPTLQSVIDCSMSDRSAAIIADGGIKNSGDAVKALAAGADFIMLGSVLSGTDETPGDFLTDSRGDQRKIYRGMASREAQRSWRNRVSSVEGVSTTVAAKGKADKILTDFSWGIKSGLSYSGCSSLAEFRSKSEFIIQTSAGMRESSTHIMLT